MTAAIFSDPQALGMYRSADIVIGFGVFALTAAVSNATNANVSRMVGMRECIALPFFLLSPKYYT